MKTKIFDLVIFDPAARERVVQFAQADILPACDFLDGHSVGYAIFRHDAISFADRENPFSAANLN